MKRLTLTDLDFSLSNDSPFVVKTKEQTSV